MNPSMERPLLARPLSARQQRICTVEGCNSVHVSLGMCGMHVARWRRHGTTERLTTPSFTTNRTASGCLEWQGYRDPKGYGRLTVDQKGWLAHRYVWFLANGPIADGLEVCHECDNPACVELTHLFIGTQAENMLDMRSKRREFVPRGERHARHRLTEQQVGDIRRRYAEGGTSYRKLAAEYGMTRQGIAGVIKGLTWKHV